jgi:hypothetical protein
MLYFLPDHLVELKYVVSDIVELVLHKLIVRLALTTHRALHFQSEVDEVSNGLFVVLFVDAGQVGGEFRYLTD